MEKNHHRDMSAEELVEYARSMISMPVEKRYRERVEVFRQHGMGERFSIFLTNLQREKESAGKEE
ncbi:MAG: hypothetical protein IJ362_08750 [Oscillospiraceae bacterium]|nr:hypothetical protein [Oscillospiraceae bacterium]